MLNSIIERHRKITPLSDTEIKVIRSATKLFLTQGFSKTTHRQIAEESGIGLGTITYHYKVTTINCERIAKEMFGKFVSRLDGGK